MRRFRKFFLLAALAFLPLLSLAKPSEESRETKPPGENTAQAAPRLEGQYEGTATNKAQQAIPLVINLRYDGGRFSGQINSSYGVYPITGGTRNGDSITIEFDASGDKGAISAKFSGDTLVGTFSVGDDSGPINLTKISDFPNRATKSQVATPILILGVYHMANPGLDEANIVADDVLTPKRRKEIENLCEQLLRFQPTKIAIEAPYRDSYWPEQYRKYLAGQY